MDDSEAGSGLTRARMDVVRGMQAHLVAEDPILDAMCEVITRDLRADAAVVTLLLEDEQVFIGTFGLRSNPGAMRRQHSDAMLTVRYFEELRMDENPAMRANPMVHGEHDSFRSVVTAPIFVDGTVVGALNVLTRTHRPQPYGEIEMAKVFQARDRIQAHLAFGVLVRKSRVA